MERRRFIALLGTATAASLRAVAGHAQQGRVPTIGFLNGGSSASAHLATAFRLGLGARGLVEGVGVSIEYRWADGDYDRMPALAAELVGRGVALIALGGGPSKVLAAKVLPPSLPVVIVSGADPVKAGFVTSLSRPGGNLTGVHFFTVQLEAKRLGLLRELVPTARSIGVIVNPTSLAARMQEQEVRQAGRELGMRIEFQRASTAQHLDAAVAAIKRQGLDAMLVAGDPFFNSRRQHIVELAARDAIPALYEQREFAEAGGLASYGTSVTDAYRQAGIYAARILGGEKAGDLPIVQSARFELVINVRTAKALRLTVPPSLLARADDLIA